MANNPTRSIRKIGNLDFVAGGRDSITFDTEGVLFRILLRLTFTVTNGSTGPATPLFQALSRLIKRAEILINGTDTPQSLPGYLLALESYLINARPALGMEATVVTTNSAATTYDVVLPIYLNNPYGRRLDDTFIAMTGLQQMALHIDWGTVSDMFGTLNGATVAVSEASVHAEYVLNYRNSPSNDGTPTPAQIRWMDYQEVDITSTNPAFEITVDNKTGLYVQSVLVVATVDGVASDAVINKFELKSGSNVMQRWDARVLRSDNLDSFRIPPATLSSFPLTGIYMIDPKVDGQGKWYGLDTRPGIMPTDLKLSMDVTKQSGTNKVIVRREGWK